MMAEDDFLIVNRVEIEMIYSDNQLPNEKNEYDSSIRVKKSKKKSSKKKGLLAFLSFNFRPEIYRLC